MRKVSFKVAKAIKNAGYPQAETDDVYRNDGVLDSHSKWIGGVTDVCCDAPTYIEVWLWLWRKKKIYFGIEAESYPHDGTCLNNYQDIPYLDPEDAIVEAIEHLVENNVIQ